MERVLRRRQCSRRIVSVVLFKHKLIVEEFTCLGICAAAFFSLLYAKFCVQRETS